MNTRLESIWRASIVTLGIAIGAISSTASADEGHSDDAPAAAEGRASPRVEAHSDLFELVGVVENGQMTIYLDRYATNEPVTGARIEFEAGAKKGVAAAQPDGTYAIQDEALAKPGKHAFSFTVTAGRESDLLTGELDIADPHANERSPPGRTWLRWAGIAAAAVVIAAAAGFLVRRRHKGGYALRKGNSQ